MGYGMSSEQQSESKSSQIQRAKSAYPAKKKSPERKQVSVIDLTSDKESYRMRPSTAIRVQQANAIELNNEKLKARKRPPKKGILPQLDSASIGQNQFWRKNPKTKKVTLHSRYNPVGIIEDFTEENEDYEGSKLSMQGKMKRLEYEQQKKKIELMRKSNEKWLKPGAQPKENAEPNNRNLDIVLFSMKPEDEITLSVY